MSNALRRGPIPSRLLPVLLALLALVAPVAAERSLEERVAEIERVNVTAPWQESAKLIEALGEDRSRLDAEQAFRVQLVEARNQTLGGDLDEGIRRVEALVDARAPNSDLRVRSLTLAVNIVAIRGEFDRAFELLKTALESVPADSAPPPRLLGMASYLYLRVGEEQRAVEYARQALEGARIEGTEREVCVALSDYALALELMDHAAQAEALRREQIDACTIAGDPVFVAAGHNGVGKALLAQNLPHQAMPWLRSGLDGYRDSGFMVGMHEVRLNLGEALLRTGQDFESAKKQILESIPFFEQQQAWANLERARRLLSEIAERAGHASEALAQLRLADDARKAAERDTRRRRLTFLQAEFESLRKDRQIALLDSDRRRQAAELQVQQRTQWLQGLGLFALVAISGLLIALLLISARERRRYRVLSERDGLTGLLNHQSTLAEGRVAFERGRRELAPFTAIVADIDRFKQINDRFGHAAGDAVLKDLGGLLGRLLPRQAVVGRSGGEEFTVLLAATAEQSRAMIEELRRRIEPLAVFGHRVAYSLSFGLCQADERHATLEDVLRAADMALYQAKRSGRNRLVEASNLAEPGRPEPGLVVVGTGIQLGRHLSARCLSEIQEADCVLALTDAPAFAMLQEIRSDLIDLRVHYAEGKDRRQTYREMDDAIMAEVRGGRRVCAVFYGHPGVFADVPHAVIRKARAEGYRARMEPGISSEACLYADLGIDPGRNGVQSLEATQFLVEDRQIDPRSLLLLWQVALTGDLACTRFHAEPAALEKLVARLLLDYPADHEVILYEAAHLPIEPFRADRMALAELPRAHYEEYTTLVIPALVGPHPRVAQRFIESVRTSTLADGAAGGAASTPAQE